MIHHGDLFDVLPTLDAESIDAGVTDPPYGIGFMGREWDTFKPGTGATRKLMHPRERVAAKRMESDNPNVNGRWRSPALSPSQIDYDYSTAGLRGFQQWTERWAVEVFRVLKPGSYLLVCGAPRSFHRMTAGVEDAGFEIRDCFSWLFGSGFPKSLNLPDGRGTALKPAWEPIIVARKPFKGSVAANVAQHGTGVLNIDACRIEGDVPSCTQGQSQHAGTIYGADQRNQREFVGHDLGRWPANVILDEEAAAMLDAQTGDLITHPGTVREFINRTDMAPGRPVGTLLSAGDSGGPSRFYYVAKPSREERDYGCEGLPALTGGQATDRAEGSAGLNNPRAGAGRTGGGRNGHPTVKPVELMRWLVKLVTPIAIEIAKGPASWSTTSARSSKERTTI